MIYLLTRKDDNCGYDEYAAKVIRAETEAEARKIANELVGDEGQVWENPEWVSCEIIEPQGESCVILADFHAG